MAMLATACTKDDSALVGNESLVSFSVSSPELQTRYGEGTTATNLEWAFYDETGAQLTEISGSIDNFSGKHTINVALVDGRQYTALFWASAPAAPYTVDWANKKMSVTTTGLTANNEAYDAFYKYTSVDPAKKVHKIELTRPFAQINIATADKAAAKSAGVEVATSEVAVVKGYKTLNLVDGEVSDKAEFTFSAAALPNEPATVEVGGKTYDMLAMNYVLVHDKELVNVALTMVDTDGKTLTRNYTTVPVQRNYRTYILGNLLTTPNEFNVETKPGFDGEEEYEFATSVNGVTYATVQEAVDAATDGAVIDVAPGIHNEIVKVTGAKNITLRAAGEGVVLAGLDHQSNSPASSTVKVEGITIDNSIVVTRATEGGWFTGTSPEIAPCVGLWGGHFTFNDCKFIVAGTSGRETGVMTWWTGANLATLAFNNCEFVGKDDHENARAMQIYGKVNMTVTNCTFKTYKDYSLKYVAGEGNVATFEGNKVYNSENFVELGSSSYAGKNYTVNINNTTYGDGVNSHVVANEEGQTVVVDGATYVRSLEAFAAAVASDAEEISIALGVDVTVDIAAREAAPMGGQNTKTITIDGNDHILTFNQTNSDWANVFCYGKLVLKNMTINKSGHGTDGGAWNKHVIMFNCEVELDNVTINHSTGVEKNASLKNVVITEDEGFYGLWVTADGQTVNIDGLTIKATNGGRGIKVADEYVDAPASVTLNVANASFTTAKKAAVLVTSTAGAVVNWGEGNNISCVAEDTEFAVWVDDGRAAYADKVVVNGAYSKVEGVVVDIVEVESVADLKDALVDAGNAGAGNTIINLAEGEYTMPADWTPISVDGYHGADVVTLNGNGAVLKGMTTSLFNGGFAGGSGIVIKDLTIEGATIVANNTQGYGAFVNCADSMAEITLINCHLINSSITTPNNGADESRMGGLVGWTSGYSNVNDGPVKTYVNIKDCSVVGCTLKGFGSIGGICGHAGASDWTYTTIENCTVTGNTLISTDDGSWRVGVAVGTANVGQVTVKNLTENGNTLVQGDKVAPTGVRSYVGRLALGTTGSFVVDGVAITE